MKHLGKASSFPSSYSPHLLESIPRQVSRVALGLNEKLPFSGHDTWNCYELTWVGPSGNPLVGLLRFEVSAESPYLVESKSVKLYLGGFTFETVHSPESLVETIQKDISAAIEHSQVTATVTMLDSSEEWMPSNGFTSVTGAVALKSELLRSRCPVTGQPDYGTCVVLTSSNAVTMRWLDDYLIEQRDHQGFHEECCERLFMRITEVFRPELLSVGCFYTRRGGVDINPIRRTPGMLPDSPSYLQYRRTIRQ